MIIDLIYDTIKLKELKGWIKLKFKGLMCIVNVALICFTNFCNMGASALFGNTHYNLGKKIIEKSDKELSKAEEEAFLSGMIYADIGRFKFDKDTGVNSDSDKFVEEMERLAKTSEEKWFAYGFKIHVFQDKKTKQFLKEVFESGYSTYSEYATYCGVLDSYFSQKSGILCNELLDKFNFKQVISNFDIKDLSKMANVPEDQIESLTKSVLEKYSDYTNENHLCLYSDLIKSVYKSFGFEISLDEINEQAGNLVGAFIIISELIRNKQEIPEKLSSKIETKSDDMVELCRTKFKFI